MRTLERTKKAARVLAKEFEDDPVIRYMLCAFESEEKRVEYLPNYFDKLIKAAALNHAKFDEANDWSACAVWMPPKCRVDNTLTLLPAGFISLLWNCGIQGCSVCFVPLSPYSVSFSCTAAGRWYSSMYVSRRGGLYSSAR